jgi:hypothetical protein
MVAGFELEALRYTLDGDTVQNLLREEAPKWRISVDAALTLLQQMVSNRLLELYEHRDETGQDLVIDPARLTKAYVASTLYTFMAKTDLTIPRVNEIQSAAERSRLAVRVA